MSYCFVKITTYNQFFLKTYYQKNPEIIYESYSSQFNHLMSQGFSWSDFYAKHLNTIGVEAYEIVANAMPAQNTWAKEHKMESIKSQDIIKTQLKALKPDVVLFQDPFSFDKSWIASLKTDIKSIKKIIGWCCCPFLNYVTYFDKFDFILTGTPGFLHNFQKLGLTSYQINHAFETSLLPKIIDNKNWQIASDVVFLGSIILGADYHLNRQVLLEKIIKSQLNVKIYSNLPTDGHIKKLLKYSVWKTSKTLTRIGLANLIGQIPVLKKAALWQDCPIATYSQTLKQAVNPPLYGLKMLQTLSRSKVGLNIHGEIADQYAGNVRLYEVTGVGSCLVTDWKKNLGDLFEIDREVVAYKSPEECVEKIKWLLEHPKEREEIAKAGQARTLKDHTFAQRAVQLDEIIRKELKVR